MMDEEVCRTILMIISELMISVDGSEGDIIPQYKATVGSDPKYGLLQRQKWYSLWQIVAERTMRNDYPVIQPINLETQPSPIICPTHRVSSNPSQF